MKAPARRHIRLRKQAKLVVEGREEPLGEHLPAVAIWAMAIRGALDGSIVGGQPTALAAAAALVKDKPPKEAMNQLESRL